MRILALDTATAATAVAVLDTAADRAVARRDDPPPGARPGHTARLLALVAEAMREAECDWTQIDRIAVGVGPGTFTGLRIGIATAQALARSRQIEIVGVSTLHSLAAAAAAATAAVDGDATNITSGAGADVDGVLGVIDARRREVFAAGWAPDAAAHAVAVPLIGAAPRAPAELAAIVAETGMRWVAVGDGAIAFRDVLQRAGVVIPADGSERHRVDAVQHCRLGAVLPPQAPDAVRPSYLRLPDAEITRQAARQR